MSGEMDGNEEKRWKWEEGKEGMISHQIGCLLI
jgi:hypothetical protein